jgi:hypothetical protein
MILHARPHLHCDLAGRQIPVWSFVLPALRTMVPANALEALLC